MDKQKRIKEASRKIREKYKDWKIYINGPKERVELVNESAGSRKLLFEVTKCFLILWKLYDKYDVIISQGGTGSSKTYSKCQLLILKAIEGEKKIRILGQDMPNLKDGPIQFMDEIRKRSPIVDEWIVNHHGGDHVYTFFTGSTIKIKSVADAQDAKQGKSELTFFNEVNGITKDVYDEIADRTYGKVLMDYNPTAKFWVHEHLITEPGHIRIITNYRHNRFLPKKGVEKILRHKEKNPNRWRVYGLGLTGITEGVIFPNVEWISPEEFPDINDLRKFGYGSDYGFANDPLTLVAAGLYQGCIYAKGLCYQSGLFTPDFAAILGHVGVDPFDPIAFDDSQAKEQAEILKDQYGYNVLSANRRGGSILSGIDLLQQYPIKIVKDENWMAEQENYKWVQSGSKHSDVKKPVDKFNHYWDALRYWALEMLGEPESRPYEQKAVTI